ncbi:ribokinase [Arthrobacter monumenti]
MSGVVLVLGSLNVDEVANVHKLPAHGETVTALHYEVHPGGKGANQAVAAVRAGATVRMVGAVGEDSSGRFLQECLEREGITCSLRSVQGATGRALILVQRDGENVITLIPGANHEVTVKDAEQACEDLTPSDLLLMQLELPLGVVRAAARKAKAKGARVVLNAAPAAEDLMLADVDVLVVNEHECLQIAGKPADADPLRTASELAVRHGLTVIVTLGADGAGYTGGGTVITLPSPSVHAVDTTAAGDTFVGYLASALLNGDSMEDATALAIRAGSLAVTKPGAQPSIPRRQELVGRFTPYEGDAGASPRPATAGTRKETHATDIGR